MLSQVITKVILEPCVIILVTPEWRDYPWWKTLDLLTISRVYLPADQPTYKADGQPCPMPGPHWRTAISLIDSTKWNTPAPWHPITTWVQNHCQHKSLADITTSILIHTRSGLDTDDPSSDSSMEENTPTQSLPSHPTQPNLEEYPPSHPTPPQHAHSPIPKDPLPHTHNSQSQPLIQSPPKFKFWHHMTEEEREIRSKYKTWGGRGKPHPPPKPTIPPPTETPHSVLDISWATDYENSLSFSGIWKATQDPTSPWPARIQLHGNKLYLNNKLCVPENLLHRVLWSFHISSGHMGITKFLREIEHRFTTPPNSQIKDITEQIRRNCTICQATTPPHYPKDGRQVPFPIPERLMHSMCLDVFSMPSTQWLDQEYDSILLCVDRLSGWMIACPTLKLGLTAEKAAHLVLDRGWEPFGIPATIHSDMGPQFVGQWWKTMCGRLGIQQTYSQPH